MTQAETARNARSRGGTIGLQGRRRQLEIAREDEAKRQQLATDLLDGLNRAPSAADRITAATLAATVVRADRLRSAGRSDLEERRLVVQLQRAIGMKPAPAESTAKPSNAATAGLDYLREKYGPSTDEAAR